MATFDELEKLGIAEVLRGMVNGQHGQPGSPTRVQVEDWLRLKEFERTQTTSASTDNTLTLTDTQRNGSITGIGIVLGFSLTFSVQWTLGSEAWHYFSVIPLVVALPGLFLQLRALFKVLSLPLVAASDHKSIVNIFLWGVILVLFGYIFGVVVDLGMDKGWLQRW